MKYPLMNLNRKQNNEFRSYVSNIHRYYRLHSESNVDMRILQAKYLSI